MSFPGSVAGALPPLYVDSLTFRSFLSARSVPPIFIIDHWSLVPLMFSGVPHSPLLSRSVPIVLILQVILYSCVVLVPRPACRYFPISPPLAPPSCLLIGGHCTPRQLLACGLMKFSGSKRFPVNTPWYFFLYFYVSPPFFPLFSVPVYRVPASDSVFSVPLLKFCENS